MSFQDDILGGLEFLEDELAVNGAAQTFTWKGAEVPCVPNRLNKGTVVTTGRFEGVIGFTLNVRRDNFRSVDSTLHTVDSDLMTMDNNMPHPVSGRTLIFRGFTYEILAATEDSSRAYYQLDLKDEHSGR